MLTKNVGSAVTSLKSLKVINNFQCSLICVEGYYDHAKFEAQFSRKIKGKKSHLKGYANKGVAFLKLQRDLYLVLLIVMSMKTYHSYSTQSIPRHCSNL